MTDGSEPSRFPTGSAAGRDSHHHRLRQVMESALDAFVSMDPQGRIVEWNRTAEEMFGWSRAQALGQELAHLIIPESHRDAHRRGVQRFVAGGEGAMLNRRMELTALDRSGTEIPVELAIAVVEDASTCRFHAFLHDISDRKRAEQQLGQREKQLAEAQRIARLGSWQWEPITGEVVCSDELYAIYGLDPHSVPPTLEVFLQHVHPEDQAAVRAEIDDAVAIEGPFAFEHRIVRPDGEARTLQARGQVRKQSDGQMHMFGTAQDITERKRHEETRVQLLVEKLRRSELERAHAELERRAAELARLTKELEQSNRELDRFAHAVSHDLKAPLRAIKNLGEWLREDLGDELRGESEEHLQLMQGRIRRMETLIDGLLEFSRAGWMSSRVERVQVRALIEDVLAMLDVPERAEIRLDPKLPELETVTAPLEHVFLNLLSNAVKYGDRDHLTVVVGVQDHGEVYEFSVEDNGPGIAPEHHERIWQMFETLHRRDTVEATGVGLAVVKKLVETQRGSVSLESERGAGTRFRFTWPKHPVTADEPSYT